METIKELLTQRAISNSTKKLYIKKLEMLHKSLGVEGEDNYDFLKDTDRTLEWINQFSSAKRRSLLNSAMVGISPASKTIIPEDVAETYQFYRDKMLAEGLKYSKEKEEQKKTETESKNWATMIELKRVLKTYAQQLKIKKIGISSPPTKSKDIETLQKLLVGLLYTTQNPRRLEYGNMTRINEDDYFKLPQDERENNNYIVKKSTFKMYFSFGDVKVKDPLKRSLKVDINKTLLNIIRIWYKTTPNATSFLLTNQGNRQCCNGLSKMLIQRVFEPTGRDVGASMIRKIYHSEKAKNDRSLKEKMEIAETMNHSAQTAELHYVKKD